MTNENSLDKKFGGLTAGMPIKLKTEISGVINEDIYVYVGDCKQGKMCIPVKFDEESKRIMFGTLDTVQNPELVKEVTQIEPLLYYFRLRQ